MVGRTRAVAQPRGQGWGAESLGVPKGLMVLRRCLPPQTSGGRPGPPHPMAARRSALRTAHTVGGAALDHSLVLRAGTTGLVGPCPGSRCGPRVWCKIDADPAGDSVALTPLEQSLGPARARGRGRAARSLPAPPAPVVARRAPTRGAPSVGRGVRGGAQCPQTCCRNESMNE